MSTSHRIRAGLAVGFALALTACSPGGPSTPPPGASASPSATVFNVIAPLSVTSDDFVDGGGLAATFASCQGDNLNPELTWAEGPAGTASYAIVMTDPDARYQHWLHFDIPADVTTVAQGGSTDLAGTHGKNTHYDLDYFGPCPPAQHHYVFTVYALDALLSPSKTFTVADFLKDSEGHVLAQGSITGLYPADPA